MLPERPHNPQVSSTTSAADSPAMIFCPVVRVITVSGVISMYSMRSEFNTSGRWLSRVSWIMDEGLQQHYRLKTPGGLCARAGVEPDHLSLSRDRARPA